MHTSPRDSAELWLRNHPIRVASAATRIVYRDDFRRLLHERRVTFEPLSLLVARTGTEHDWIGCQAAIYWQGARRLSRLVTRYDLQPDSAQSIKSRLSAAMADTLSMLNEVQKMPALLTLGRRRRAARLDLLPANWQEQLFVRASARQRIALLLFTLTGARPSELTAGVLYKIVAAAGADTLELTVAGAKQGDQSGQSARVLTLSSTGAQGVNVRRLIELLASEQRALCSTALEVTGTVAIDAEPRQWMYRLARAIWPEQKERPTPYSFRYAFRRQCLIQGADARDQALALGHQSTMSAFAYGARHSHTKGDAAELKVKAAYRPREHMQKQQAWVRSQRQKPMQRERDSQTRLFGREREMERS